MTYSCKKNVAQSFSIEKNNGIIKFTLTDCAGNVNYCSFDTSSGTTSETVTPKTYTVTINSSNTGVSKVSTSSVSCSTTGTSCNVSLPTITAKSNYTVVGFNTAKSATTATYKSGSTISISGNMTLYAIVKQQVTEVEEPDDTEDQEETPVTKTCKEYSRVSANSNNCGEYSSSVATTATVSSKSACTAKCDGVSNINCKSSVKKGTCSYKYCTQVLDHYNYKTTTSKSACTSEGGTVTGATTNGYTCKIPNNEENCTSQSSSATDFAACTKICTASAQKSGCSFTATSYTCSFTMRSGCKTTYNCTGISSKDGCTTKLSGSKCILYSLQ